MDDRIADILWRCLDAHGGQFDPSRISSKASGQQPGDERIYSKFNKLLLPGGLRPFVERHPEFSWTSREPKGRRTNMVSDVTCIKMRTCM